MAQNKKAQEEPQVETQNNSFEDFIKKYQNIIFWTVIGILLIVFGIMAYQKWILNPAKEEARSQTFVAEQQFRNGNYEQVDIIDFATKSDVEGNEKLGQAVADSIVYFKTNMKNANGLAMYYPCSYLDNLILFQYL